MSESTNTEQRNFNIDLLKTLAIFFVIIVHLSAKITDLPVGGSVWSWSVLYNSIAHAAVPLFFMCSGSLMLKPEKPLSVKRLYTHNILRIITAMLFWGMLYKFYHLIVWRLITPRSIKNIIIETLLFKQEFHFYFLHIILIVYIALPITRIIIENATRAQLKYLLGVWFVFAVVYPTVKNLYPFSLLSGIPLQWLINLTYGSIGYTILGYYLNKYRISVRRAIIFIITGFLLAFGATYTFSLISDKFYNGLLEGMSVGICVYTAGIFGLFISLKKFKSKLLIRAVTYISKASFYIYLCHVFFIYALGHLGLDIYAMPVVLSIPVAAIVILIVSAATYFVFSKLPFAKYFS